MNINSLGNATSMLNLLAPESTGDMRGSHKAMMESLGFGRDIVDVSSDAQTLGSAGELRNLITSLSEADRTDAKNFFQGIRSDIKSGTFNAADAAENIPEELKSLALENGIDLEEIFENMESRYQAVEKKSAEMNYGFFGTNFGETESTLKDNLVSMLLDDDDS